MECLHQTTAVKVFRFVDDFLIFYRSNHSDTQQCADRIVEVFRSCMSKLQLTTEFPTGNRLRFLDLEMFLSDHVCWQYAPRSKKSLLPYSSAHSKLVKRAIAKSCLGAALTRSCHHTMCTSFDSQVRRLRMAGYPDNLLCSIAEGLLEGLKQPKKLIRRQEKSPLSKTAVIPYLHRVSHCLKKVAQKAGIRVVFSAKNKFSGMCNKVNREDRGPRVCDKKHAKKFVECCHNAVYEIPLSCGRCYIGQTGRCVNDRLREHRNLMRGSVGSHLAAHSSVCGCHAMFDQCKILRRYSDQRAREIYEAFCIDKKGDMCVSVPSLALLTREIAYLSSG